jgi:hypothetical protein
LSRDLATGREPDPDAIDWSRPFAERGGRGGYGARCGLGDPGFDDWTCEPGLKCRGDLAAADEADTVGTCLPETVQTGDPCEVGRVRPHADSHRDRVIERDSLPCGEAVCNVNKVGFPGGMCTASCADLPEHAVCGQIAILTPFNNCLARNEPFDECVRKHTAPAGLRSCTLDLPCRDDFICARSLDGAGACIPPYFLFQLRVDGHR